MGDMLSQEEIDALLKGTSFNEEDAKDDVLDESEKDALGEIGNISMGTAATTLFTLLGQKVTITTPKVSIVTMKDLGKEYTIPFVAVEVKYREGLEGANLLILQERDVKVITDLMMGGDGTNFSGELTELHLSAIGEAMNQMIGSAATSLSEMFHKKIDIYPPSAFSIDFSNNELGVQEFKPDEKIVKIAFKMIVGEILDSEIMQLVPVDFAKALVQNLFKSNENDHVHSDDYTVQQEQQKGNNEESQGNQQSHTNNHLYSDNGYYQNYNNAAQPSRTSQSKESVNVQPVQFPSFDEGYKSTERESITLIKDVPLEITAELGRTSKKISEILEFSPGTVIELDRLVGEPLDILVNGQFIAKGEVVVIDENYGIRITDILNPTKRMNKIK